MNHTSREYAEALFELALEEDKTPAYAEGLALVEEALADNRGFLDLLASPAISREERMETFSRVFQERIPMSELILLRMMISRGHARRIPEMAACYRDLEREHRGESLASVTTAVPLTEAETDVLRRKLEQKFGRKMVLDLKVDPGLIGGVRVETEGRVLDGSLRARLQDIKEVMDQ
ncbi:MAG: ATP synthase F1 subunit delta [Clostridia bacterium]|nr:ATP synthase F1 subunit delta [Clostridia bacterium]